MPRKSFRLNITLIDELLAKKEWTRQDLATARPDEFHPSLLSKPLNDKIPFAKRKGVSLDTLLKIAGKLDYQGKHLELTLDDDGNPHRSVASDTPSAPQPTAELAFTYLGLTIKAIAQRDVLRRVTPEQLTDAWQSLYFAGDSCIVDKIDEGSIILSMRADRGATIAILSAFLTWRLQYLGVYQLDILAREGQLDVFNIVDIRYRFANDDIRHRFETLVFSAMPTTIVTPNGLHSVRWLQADAPLAGRANYRMSAARWCFQSTLSSQHITRAERYWNDPTLELPEHIHLLTDVQPAILVDDGTFLNQPYYQPS